LGGRLADPSGPFDSVCRGRAFASDSFRIFSGAHDLFDILLIQIKASKTEKDPPTPGIRVSAVDRRLPT